MLRVSKILEEIVYQLRILKLLSQSIKSLLINSNWKSLRQKVNYEERPEERKFEDNTFFERLEKIPIETTKAVAVADNDEIMVTGLKLRKILELKTRDSTVF